MLSIPRGFCWETFPKNKFNAENMNCEIGDAESDW